MDSLTKNKRFPSSLKILSLVAYLFTSSHCFAQEEEPSSEYEHWYQVEILLFKLLPSFTSEEKLLEYEVTYPSEIIAIGEVDTKPNFLSQLEQLIGSQTTSSENNEVFDYGETTFLFESASRQYRYRQLLEGEMIGETLKSEIGGTSEKTGSSNVLETSQFDAIINSKRHRAYFTLTGSQLNLGGIAGSLRRSSKYELLMHQAWLQPITTQNAPILIQTGKCYDERYEIDGTINFKRNRYLHMNVDLWFTEFIPKYNHQEALQVKDVELDAETRKKYPILVARANAKNTHEPLQSYRMAQSRRMRSDEIHYIDHPLFGMVLSVQRFKDKNRS